MALLRDMLTHVARSSHQAACRNALAASTALAARTQEREEVADFLARHTDEPGGRGRRVG